jgi:hypothetical protein
VLSTTEDGKVSTKSRWCNGNGMKMTSTLEGLLAISEKMYKRVSNIFKEKKTLLKSS